MAVAAGLEAASAILGGVSSAESASYGAQVAKNNALIATQNAGYSAGAGSAQTEQEGLKAAAQLGDVRAAAAANNLNVNSGSPAAVQVGQRELGELDTATVANRAAEAVYGYTSQAEGFQAQSSLLSSEVPYDLVGGALKAGGDVAGAAPDIPGASAIGQSIASGAPSLPFQYSFYGGNPTMEEPF
jgi:hypothetical protein